MPVQNFHSRRKYIKTTISSYATFAIGFFIQLTLIPAISQNQGNNVLGSYVIINSIITYLAIGVTWFSGSFTRYLGKLAALDDDFLFYAYAQSKWVYTLYSIIISLLTWSILIVYYGSVLNNNSILYSGVAATVNLIVVYSYNGEKMLLHAIHQQHNANICEGLGIILFGTLGYYFAINGKPLEYIFYAQLIGSIATQIAASISLRTENTVINWYRIKPNLSLVKYLFNEYNGLDYAIYGFLILSVQADILLLGSLTSSVTVASYFILWRFPEFLNQLVWRVSGIIHPTVIALEAKKKHEDIKKMYSKIGKIISSVTIIACLTYSVFGEKLIAYWLHQSTSSYTRLDFIIVSFAAFLVSSNRLPSGLAFSAGRVKMLNLITLIELVLKIFLTVILFKNFNYLTPAISIIIINSLFCYWAYKWVGRRTLTFKAQDMLS